MNNLNPYFIPPRSKPLPKCLWAAFLMCGCIFMVQPQPKSNLINIIMVYAMMVYAMMVQQYHNYIIIQILLMEAPPITQDQLELLLEWLAGLHFSRPKKNLNRDFSDGVLVAQIMKQYYPSLVQMHNYQPASSSTSKYINWKTLNQKVFRKLGFVVHRNDIQSIITVVPGIIDRVLFLLYTKIRLLQDSKVENKGENSGILQGQLQVNPTQTPPVPSSPQNSSYARQMSAQLAQKQQIIRELRDTIDILEQKMKKMEQLNKLKDGKIQALMRQLEEGM